MDGTTGRVRAIPSLAEAVEPVGAGRSPLEPRSAIETVIDRLPPAERRALGLRKLAGLEYPAIARALRCTEAQARARVVRAFRTLHRALESGELPRGGARRRR